MATNIIVYVLTAKGIRKITQLNPAVVYEVLHACKDGVGLDAICREVRLHCRKSRQLIENTVIDLEKGGYIEKVECARTTNFDRSVLGADYGTMNFGKE